MIEEGLTQRHPQDLSWMTGAGLSTDHQIVAPCSTADCVANGADGGTRITWTIHQDVKWHDGDALTAEDVAFSYVKLYEAQAPNFYDGLTNLQAVTYNDTHVNVYSNSSGLFEFDRLQINVYKKAIWDNTPDDDPINFLNSLPVGTGPYKWQSRTPGEFIVLERNADFYNSPSSEPGPNLQAPEVYQPSNITYTFGITGNSLSWIVIDDNPNFYALYKNGFVVSSGSWVSGVNISYSVDNLAVGNYSFTLFVSDLDNFTITSTVWVIVEPLVYDIPSIDGLGTFYYEVETTGHFLNWNATDNNPTTYEILRDGVPVASGAWSSQIPITLSVDGLLAGEYNFTIEVTNDAGYSATNTVWVTVYYSSSQSSETSSTTSGTSTSATTFTSDTPGFELLIVILTIPLIFIKAKKSRKI
jgi:ABC-type transport system substrate-binding protein